MTATTASALKDSMDDFQIEFVPFHGAIDIPDADLNLEGWVSISGLWGLTADPLPAKLPKETDFCSAGL